MNTPRPTVRCLRWCVVLFLLPAALPARAWDPDIHYSLVRAAIGASAAAEARVPLDFRDAVYKEVREPDYTDKACSYHCSLSGPGDAAAQAEQLLKTLTDPKVALRPYQRAQMIGRYLHFVGDSVHPAALGASPASKLPNFFANMDFVFWRQPRPLAAPLAPALRARGAEALWANENLESANPAVFRLAVNTLCDALMLLAPRSDAAAAPDAGPVHFLVNRVDNGVAGKATSAGWEKTGHTYSNSSPYWVDSSGGYDVWQWNAGSKGGGQSFKKGDLMERPGVQIAELTVRKEPAQVTLRILFFNNSPQCAGAVGLKAGTWTWKMSGGMPPNSMAAVEVAAPPDVLTRRLGHTAHTDNCEGTSLASATFRADRRLVYGNAGSPPLFDVIQETDITRGSETSRRAVQQP